MASGKTSDDFCDKLGEMVAQSLKELVETERQKLGHLIINLLGKFGKDSKIEKKYVTYFWAQQSDMAIQQASLLSAAAASLASGTFEIPPRHQQE